MVLSGEIENVKIQGLTPKHSSLYLKQKSIFRMKIQLIESINDFKNYFGFQADGIILENDLDIVENETDLFDRKRLDAQVICTVAANCTGKCLDIGTSHGRSAFKLSTNIKDGIVYTVNILPEQYESTAGELTTHLLTKEEIGSFYRQYGMKNIEQIYANTQTWEILNYINDLSLVFIDGAHDTDCVYTDTKKTYERIKKGGFILWHDFSPLCRSKYSWIDSAMQGVEKFLSEFGIENEIINLRNSWVGVLQKSKDSSEIFSIPQTLDDKAVETYENIKTENFVYVIHSGQFNISLEKMLISLKQHCNCTLLFNHIDMNDDDLNLIKKYFGNVIFFEIDNSEWNGKRMACKIFRFLKMPFSSGDNVFVLDTDLLIQSNIFEVFEQHFDVFVTSRYYNYWYPINGGVWGFKYNKNSIKFLKFFQEQIEFPTWPPLIEFQIRFGHLGNLDWWCDQDFLCIAYQYRLPFDCRLVDIGYKYNFCPILEEDIPGTIELAKKEIIDRVGNSDYRVLHFKGRLKDLLSKI